MQLALNQMVVLQLALNQMAEQQLVLYQIDELLVKKAPTTSLQLKLEEFAAEFLKWKMFVDLNSNLLNFLPP